MTEHLGLDDLLKIASAILRTPEPPVRDYGLLESAAMRPRASAFGADAYPTLHEKAAALLHSLARNHALVDGNKRLAFLAAYIMYGLNGYDLVPPSAHEGDDFVRAVARGEREVPEIATTLAAWAKPSV